jgi:autotransporter-associated beta strand protein
MQRTVYPGDLEVPMTRRFRRSLAALITGSLLALGVVTAQPAAAASLTWSGNAGSNWSSGPSWSSGSAPLSGDTLNFPASALLNMQNDLTPFTPFLLNFNGSGYSIAGNGLGAQSINQFVSGTNSIFVPIAETTTGAITSLPVNAAAGGTLALNNSVVGSFSLIKSGAGRVVLAAGNVISGITAVTAGSLIVNGTNLQSTTQVQGGVLGGMGSIGPLTATSGGVSPGDTGAGLLTVNGPAALNAGVSLLIDILGAAPGTSHDQLRVASGISLNNATLTLAGSFVGPANQTFVIVDNTSGGPIVGTFASLPEGTTFAATNGISYRITYIGGTGNDVVLTQIGRSAIRLAGVDRVDTAVKISQNAFPANGSANAVVLARGDLFPDALAGAPLAVNRGGPLLLANLVAGATTVDARTVAEIQRVLTTGKTILVLGGASAIPDSMVQQLTGLGYQVPRQFAGTDRFQTAVLIAQTGLNNPPNLFLASGVNFPDALSAGPAAARAAGGGAILLTNGNVMPTFTSQYLTSRTGATVFALGGPAAAAGGAPAGNQIVGVDRYATAVQVAQRFFPSPTALGVASGEAFPDGLTGGAHIGKIGGPLLLTAQAALPANVQSYLQSVKGTVNQLFIYGGTAAVSTQAADQINAAVA